MNWTFGRKLALGFALAVSVVAGVGVAGHRSIGELIETAEWVEHTQRVVQRLTELESLVKDSETSARGFVISGSEWMLDPHLRAVDRIDVVRSELRGMVGDNEQQTKRLEVLGKLIDEKREFVERNIEVRRTEGLEAASRLVGTGEGNVLMQRIRRAVHEMLDVERALLATRTSAAAKSSAMANSVIVWGSLLGTLLVALVGTQIARSLSQQIGAAVGHVQASAAELEAAANQQAASASEQATAVSEITTTIGELLATSRQIAESAQRVSAIASRTADAARDGDGTVAQGTQSMVALRRQVDSIVSQMLELGKTSQQIGAIVDIVSELAEQTNIVAVNATIEAAGAGESGARFFAVAEEIRKLADRVGGSAKEIRTLIDEVRSAVNAGIMTTETGSKATDLGSQQFAFVAKSLEDIGVQVGTTSEAAREIELSTKQQSSAVEQVNSAILSVADAARETTISTTQTLRTASELSGLSTRLLRLIQPNGASPRAPSERANG